MQTSILGRTGHALLILALYLFLLAPVFPVFLMSFTNDPYIMFPPESWGVK